jgi:NTP pyrophosphatase (non-canonical NTP hydrolase)
MKLNDYQIASKRTMPKPLFGGYTLKEKANYAMGLSGEAGETTDLIKKELFHGHEMDREKIKKELGDVLHYLSGLATMYGFTLEEVAMANIKKLMTRYPGGFSSEDSQKRVDVK